MKVLQPTEYRVDAAEKLELKAENSAFQIPLTRAQKKVKAITN